MYSALKAVERVIKPAPLPAIAHQVDEDEHALLREELVAHGNNDELPTLKQAKQNKNLRNQSLLKD